MSSQPSRDACFERQSIITDVICLLFFLSLVYVQIADLSDGQFCVAQL